MGRYRLIRDERGLGLKDTFSSQRPLRVDFTNREFIRRLQNAGKKSELVARAVKAGAGLRVLDCTAGLGRDALVLAHLGCEVTLVERSVTMAMLLEDGLLRAAEDPRLADTVSRIALTRGDALQQLAQRDSFDVAYLDPMFPAKTGSALVGGEMQQMQRFLGTDEDALSLLGAAIGSRCQRVVLKRPPSGEWMPPVSPDLVLKSRTSHFEIYLRQS